MREIPKPGPGPLVKQPDYGTRAMSFKWEYDVHLENGKQTFWLSHIRLSNEEPTIEHMVADINLDGELPDDRAEWHRNYTPLLPWVKAHIIRLARGLTLEGAAEHFEELSTDAYALGFCDEEAPLDILEVTDPPSYTQLRDIWRETFSERLRGACRVLAERIVELAQEHDVPAPDDVFAVYENVSVDEVDEDDPTIRELTTTATSDVWKHAKPMVLSNWYLKHAHNTQVPESTFFDAQAFLGTHRDLFPETGMGNLKVAGNHDRVHYPSTHRNALKRFDVEEIRALHREVTSDLIEEARGKGELVGQLAASIDMTKGHPWTGERDEDDGGHNTEPWILGYANDNDTRPQYYFQWATIQIVGLDIPLVLDAVPVKRGVSRGEIVDELIDTATDMVDGLSIVTLDRGFDSKDVKNACEKHRVWYLNAKKRDATDKKRMRRMRRDGQTARIFVEEARIGIPNRKKIYVPKVDLDEPGDDDPDPGTGSEYRQEMLDELGLEEDDMESSGESPLANLMDEIHEEEEEKLPDDDAASKYMVFETCHPGASPRTNDGEWVSESEQVHIAARMVRHYAMRWGIENGYKKIKQFLPRSASKDHVLRFFNFAFACTLYNCWRLVDLLVKLSVEDNPPYTPLVTAQRFREIAKQRFGLSGKPPPDW